ncbi:MAG TPA: DUF924 family protein [Burkholderiaceae bacterium]|nr:DUF924 family protein [Burkholderiaceae bacterium]
METAQSIIQFWFGDSPDDRITGQQQAALWWSKNAALDQQIRARFEAALLAAASGALDAWTDASDGLLALILLTDQFPRNMYRGDARSFDFDAQSRHWCRLALTRQSDRALRPIERVFVYLPLEHSEQLADQELACRLFGALVDNTPADRQDLYRGYLEYALRHHAVIARFGRFPHRNALLGRCSTAAELEFLAGPHSSF